MFTEVILFTTTDTLDVDLVRNMGLLYDRVILPLPDAIRSERIEWLNGMAANCPYTNSYVSEVTAAFTVDCPVARPLTVQDYSRLGEDSAVFESSFSGYVEANVGGEKWEAIIDKGINVAQDILNVFVTEEVYREKRARDGGIQVVMPLSASRARCMSLAEKYAQVLGVEAAKFALYDIEFPQDHQQVCQLLCLARKLESRVQLQTKLQQLRHDLSRELQDCTRTDQRKKLLVKYAEGLAAGYNTFTTALATSSPYVRLKANPATNGLVICERAIKPRGRPMAQELDFRNLVYQREYQREYSRLPEEVEGLLDSQRAGTAWQLDLLTFRTEAEELLGKKPTHKKLNQTGFFELLLNWLGSAV